MPFVVHRGRPILFVHVPKTGGASVEAWMRGLGPLHLHAVGQPPALRCTPQHLTMPDIRRLFGDAFFHHAFMIVRDPFARIESEYRMRVAMGGAPFPRRPAFSSWLETALGRMRRADPFHLDNHLRPQWEFAGTGVEVMRFEDGIDAAIARMAARLGVEPPAETPHELRAPDVPRVEWDEADVLRVRDAYARDFETFGYDPGGPSRRQDGDGVVIGTG